MALCVCTSKLLVCSVGIVLLECALGMYTCNFDVDDCAIVPGYLFVPVALMYICGLLSV